MTTKSSIFTSGEATSENTVFVFMSEIKTILHQNFAEKECLWETQAAWRHVL